MQTAYDEAVKPGDRLTFTYEFSLHLAEIGVTHAFELGDDVLVLGVDDRRDFSVLIGDPHDITFQAWVFEVVARYARNFWLRQAELEPEGEGVSSLLPLSYWNHHYHSLSPAERHALWQTDNTPGDFETLFRILANKPVKKTSPY